MTSVATGQNGTAASGAPASTEGGGVGAQPGQMGIAAVLVEALPYIRRFRDAVVVVKYGGAALHAGTAGCGAGVPALPEEDAIETSGSGPPSGRGGTAGTPLGSFAEDVVLLRSVGVKPVVVHGGGPQIGDLLRRLGMEAEFRDGLRVTDADTLDVARMVLVGKVNRDIVSAINVHGPLAVGLSGEDANLITAAAHPGALGYVGTVMGVDPTILRRLLAEGLIPVVATIGADEQGQAYNINADAVAGAVAESLGAAKLVFLTDVEGLREEPGDPATLLRQVTADRLAAMVDTGAAAGGMVPKAEACVRAVRGGVHRAHVLDGRVPHALLVELFTDVGIGTMVVP